MINLSKKRFVTILGHRFRRATFFRWLGASVIFTVVVLASWITLVAVKGSKRSASQDRTAPLVESEALVMTPGARQAPRPIDVFVERQRRATGFDQVEYIHLRGLLTDVSGTRLWEAKWQPGELHEVVTAKDGSETVYLYDGRNAWQITNEGNILINDDQAGELLLIRAIALDPFASMPGSPRDYRLLFDEVYEGILCAVLAYRLPGSYEARLFFDRESLQEVRRLLWLEGTRQGQREIRYENPVAWQGVTVPSVITVSAGREELMILTLDSTIESGKPSSKVQQASLAGS